MVSSSFANYSSSFDATTYIRTIGVYDEDKNLIAVAKVANKVKKIIRDKKIDVDVASEIGDVLWYCAMLADYFDVDLGKIMEDNINKLHSRKSRGVLGGSGDKR